MGVCLCKDKVEEGYLNENSRDSYTASGNEIGGDGSRTVGSHGGRCLRTDRKVSLSDTVDDLVKETLEIIGSIVDNEPEPPNSMVMLHDITDKPTGWIQLVKSLIRVVPLEHPMGPSVITLLLDDSPLPTKDSVLEVADMITHSIRRTPKRERNLCVILGCLAEKLAGPSSIAVLSDVTLGYLLGNLDEGINPDVMLFSLIALEKFAQTSENKATIKRKLALYPENPLTRLERHTDSKEFILRQVGFCARWCLDNYFLIEGRKYSYEVTDVSNVDVMLNTRDVSEYLKISPDGLEATTSLPSTTTMLTSLITEAAKILSSTAVSTSTPYSSSTDESTGFTFSSTLATSTELPSATEGMQVADSEDLLFSVVDYVIFASMLLMSTLIGVYFGFLSKVKQDNTKEYLLGGKTMNKFPVSASLIATHVSGITLLGVPSELYGHGTQYWLCIISAFSVTFLMEKIYLPVFYDLQVTSVFTYLETRFDRTVRTAASFVYAIACMIYIPIVVYVPALAFSQVTGINLHMITPVICIICIFYTTVGGLRAVVWTDTLQFILMIGATLAIIFLGIASVGGFFEVWEAAERGGRLVFFNMDPDPFVRTSFWTVTFGLSTMWIANLGVSQGCVQRFLAVPDLKVAKNSLIIFTGGLIFIKSCSCFTGLLMYAKYESCDPYTIRKINKLDQILPYYVMDVGGKIPGLPGLFVSGIFSAALSTMSSSLNTLAGTIYEDFIRHRYPKSTEKTASNVMKVLVVLLGVIVIALVFVAEKMGQVMHMAISLSGVTSGTLLGMFSSGMLLKSINTKGVIAGSVVSMISISTILIGAQLNPKPPFMPFRTDGCDANLLHNVTLVSPVPSTVQDDVPHIFKVSFMYYALLGVIIYFVVAYVVSIMTGGGEITDQRLLAPFLRDKKQYEKEQALRKHNIQYAEIDLALKELQKDIDGKQ